ncbi:L-ribulose-5-phosphate 3-epimerase [Clostridium tarantellae]|uniref:L-ribulose-5-phosphate 3-epimerase n=1 Tax=Clostridium tarantellae TaxID=39493 RepID=A0A6I1MI78_9CLOT|nr:L-ribulose-5-phosphate 3-epimerase [Clostridium tarantellae]MPQ43266.1 L-ribulose-5-phosphate 3-epimerase [Clostridium tarantellae]
MKEYELGVYEKAMPNNLSWVEKLICVRDAGFDFIEMNIDESKEGLGKLNYTKEDRLNLIHDMCKIGVPIRTMCLSAHRKYPIGSTEEFVRNKGLEIMEKAIELACDLGIRIIQLAGYDVYYEESNEITRGLFLKNLNKCVKMAAKKGIILAFETMETEFMNTVEKSMYYINKINSPYLQIYPDCGNITNAAIKYENNVVEDLNSGKGHIVAVHLKETVPGIFREIPFGTGHVNFNKIIKTAWDLGVRKYVAEFWYVGNEDWIEVLKETKIFMDNKFKAAVPIV